ncbi:MAG TPA: hypothetical protein VFN82_06810 [Solirubrobacterales bacterium]|nr:hypothetical protein [Solirubrobacterales bacterium]
MTAATPSAFAEEQLATLGATPSSLLGEADEATLPRGRRLRAALLGLGLAALAIAAASAAAVLIASGLFHTSLGAIA